VHSQSQEVEAPHQEGVSTGGTSGWCQRALCTRENEKRNLNVGKYLSTQKAQKDEGIEESKGDLQLGFVPGARRERGEEEQGHRGLRV